MPVADAEVVTRLRRAGAVVVGKTNTPEFAGGANTVNRVFGATRHPWDRALSASGSTGGGAAALSAGLIALLASYIDWIAPTFLVSLSALPAASVPAGKSASGLPIGLQVIGPQMSGPRILGCAKLVERMQPIARPPPA